MAHPVALLKLVPVSFVSNAVLFKQIRQLWRAAFMSRWHMLMTPLAPAGILVAQLINYGTQHIYPWGWRLSMALGGVPGILLFVGALCLPDTPNRWAGCLVYPSVPCALCRLYNCVVCLWP